MRTWRYIQRNVGIRATADELMQEVWFAVAREAPRYHPSARFTTWLFTIARNRIIDWARTRRAQTSLESLGYEAGAVIIRLSTDPSSGPLAAAVAAEQSSALAEALAQLPAEQRDAFLMHIEAGLSVEEIAAVAGVNFETAKSRLRYARMKLRDLLQEHA
jgi:RNA polymerase sigma factor (sigma-70 family)